MSDLASGRSLLLALVLTAFVLFQVTVVNTVSSTDLGTSIVKLWAEGFSDDPDVVITGKQIVKAGANQTVSGDTLPGIEAAPSFPQVNNALARKNFVYALDIREALADSWQSGARYRIEVFVDDGTTVSLLATLYIKQDTADDGQIEGATVKVDTGSNQVLGDAFTAIVTRL